MWLSLCFMLLSLINSGLWLVDSQTPQSIRCPMIYVTCPYSLDSKKPAVVTANISGVDAKSKLVYNWTVSGGEIIEGHGTPSIKIRTSGRALTAALVVDGLDSTCGDRASCSIIVESAPSAKLLDKYSGLRFKDEKARLSIFARALRNEPRTQGYIMVYAKEGEKRGEIFARANRAKDYLINEQGIDARRIVIAEGGIRKERAVELYIVPTGATPPKPGLLDSQD